MAPILSVLETPVKKTASPLVQDLAPILAQTARWIDTFVPDSKFRITNIPLLTWTFTPDDTSTDIGNLSKRHATAHTALAFSQREHEVRTRVHALLRAHKALDVGMRTLTLVFMQASTGVHLLVRILDQPLGGVNKGMTITTALQRMERALSQMQGIPMPTDAPLIHYNVDNYCVCAPDIRTAITLHLIAREPDRFDRMRAEGPLPTQGHSLRVQQVLTTTGEDVFAGLFPQKPA